MKNFGIRKTVLSVGIPVCFLITLFAQFRIADKQWEQVISSDGKGYYHYFIEYFVADDQRDLSKEDDYLQSHNGRAYTKYPLGTALLLTPFFGLGYTMALLGDFELTGLSYPFQLFAGIGALFYLVIGGWMLFRLLRTYQLSVGLAYLVSLAVVFGTNLLYYGVMGSTMSHVYSFAAIAAFAFTVRLAVLRPSSLHTFLAIALLGLIFSIRPFNILVVLAVPMLIADISDYPGKIRLAIKPAPIAMGVGVFGLLALLQLLIWKHQTGDWILFSYSEEGFYFTRPAIAKVLFSFNKGLLIYTPLLLLSFAGLLWWFQKSRTAALGFIGFFAVITYFISAWWCWNYASGFGLRPYIDHYAIFAIPLAIGVKESSGFFRYIIYFLALVFISLNLVQSYQYATLIMHPSGMTWEKYAYIFLKTDEKYAESLGGSFDLPPYAPNGLIRYDTFSPLNATEELLVTDEFAVSTSLSSEKVPTHSSQLYWEISMDKKNIEAKGSDDILFVFDFEADGEKTYYTAFKIDDTPKNPVNEWYSIKHTATTPVPTAETTVKIYLWNRTKSAFYLRDYEVKLYGTK